MLNDLAKLAPTIGMVGGGLLGSATDVIDGPLGTIGGATAGGDLGKAVQDWMTHTPVTGGQMLKQSAIGAGSSLVGEGLGSLFDAGGNAAADALDRTATSQAAADQSQAAIDEANATKANFGMDKGVQISNNLKDNQALMRGWGQDATSPTEMAHTAQGGNLINSVDNEALAQGNPIKTSDLITSHNITTATPQEQQALLASGIITPEGTVAQTVTPAQADQYAQKLGSMQRDARTLMENAKFSTPKDYVGLKQQYDTIDSLYQNAKDVAGTPEVNAAIAARTVTPEEKAALVDEFGQQQADSIESSINNAKTHADLVAAKRPYAEMSNLSNAAAREAQATATPAEVARVKLNNPIPKTAESTIGKALNSKVAKAAEMGSAVMGLSDPNQPAWAKAAELGVGGAGLIDAAPGLVPKMAGMLSKLSAPAIEGAAGIATMPQPTQQTEPVQQGGTNVNPYATQPGSPPSALALLAGSGMAGLLDPYTASAYAPLAQAAMPQIQKAQTAESELQQLESMLSQAGGAQGGLMGLLQKLRAQVSGGPVRTYQQNLQALQPILSQLGINSPLPSVTSTPQAAQLGFQQAQAGLNSIL